MGSQIAAPADTPIQTKERVAWTGSRLKGSPDPAPPFKMVRSFPHLGFRNPVHVAFASGQNRVFVCEQGGKILSFDPASDPKIADLVIDLPREVRNLDKAKVKGVGDLYALAFDPDFATNRFCYVCYVLNGSGPSPLPDGSRVSRFRMASLDPPKIDPASETVLITWLAGGHNGCDLQFGKDGFLYISTGDAANPNPPDGLDTGQDLSDLLSSILRIDVKKKEPGKEYAVPPDNPFVGQTGVRPEIWAYGFRNPWRMSFDRLTGDLWAGDVGWEQWEMIYRVEKGGNYGWPIMEGPQPVKTQGKRGPTPILPPALSLPHSEAASVTGGFVYRGTKFPQLAGLYLFGDWVTGTIWSARPEGSKLIDKRVLAQTTERIISFGEDAQKEIHILTYGEPGYLHHLEPNAIAAKPSQPFPVTLGQTGLFARVEEHHLAPGVIPFEVQAEMWSDGAQVQRFVALPGTSRVKFYDRAPPWPNNTGEVKFPQDGVLGRTLFARSGGDDPRTWIRLETQILHWEGSAWKAYSYLWREDQSDADLVPRGGIEKSLAGYPGLPQDWKDRTWSVASRAECLTCHNSWSGYTLAFHPSQLNRNIQRDGRSMPQLDWLKDKGLVEALKLGNPPEPDQPRPMPTDQLPNPHDEKLSLEARARAYLHVHCSACHQFGAGGTALIDVRYSQKLQDTGLLDGKPFQGTFGLEGAKIIAPGDPTRSVLFYRLAKLGPGRMPHLGSREPDPRGIDLVRRWIESLPGNRAQYPALESWLGSRDAKSPGGLDEVLRSPGASLALVGAIDSGRVDPARRETLQNHLKGGQVGSGSRDLFERYLPRELRVERLGPRIRPEVLLTGSGDPRRGEILFFQGQVSCSQCHQIKGRGHAVGPNLSDLGKRLNREKILESLLDPSRTVDPKYAAFVVETQQGKLHTGIVVARDAKEVVLKQAGNETIRIAAKEIASITQQSKSLMPEQALSELTRQQALDLLEFLTGLGK